LAFEFIPVYLGDYSEKGFKGVDKAPYGGGPGVVLRADVLKKALFEGVIETGGYGHNWKEHLTVINCSPRGTVWSHQVAKEFSKVHLQGQKDLVFICGRYEGIDERFIEHYVDVEYSLGDFVLTGGELAVMCFLDSSLRLLEGVVGNHATLKMESFENGLLEHPHYTRPFAFEGQEVPEVYLSGHDRHILQNRQAQSLSVTQKYRPDLL